MKMFAAIFLMIVTLFCSATFAAEDPSFTLKIKNSKFEPEALQVPAHQKFKLEVENLGPAQEEFESVELNREKVVAVGKKITLFLGPLSAGEYKFFSDFHRDTANGKIVVKETQ